MNVAALYIFYPSHLEKPVSYSISCSWHSALHVIGTQHMLNDNTTKTPSAWVEGARKVKI